MSTYDKPIIKKAFKDRGYSDKEAGKIAEANSLKRKKPKRPHKPREKK